MLVSNQMLMIRDTRSWGRTKGEPGHDELCEVVKHLNVQEEHPEEVVATLVDAPEMHHGVQTGSERSVQPSSPLTDKLGCSFRHIGFTFGRLHIGKMPFEPSLGHQFKAKNTILSQEHVLLEDVHSLNTLLAKLP